MFPQFGEFSTETDVFVGVAPSRRRPHSSQLAGGVCSACEAFSLVLTTFVLYYRLVQTDGTYRYPVPMWDGQRALKLIRYRAKDYCIDLNRVGVFGFSAGGHLASTLALHSATDFNLPMHDAIDSINGRPDFLGLGYPVISMIPTQFASLSSLHHLLYGYRGDELDGLEHYLSGQNEVTRNTPPVFLFESVDAPNSKVIDGNFGIWV